MTPPHIARPRSRLRGIHYDIGTETIGGGSTRPHLERRQIEREIADIADGLHANAVRITGGDLERMAQAAKAAADYDLEAWLSPMLPNADASTTLDAVGAAATIAEEIRGAGGQSVVVVGCELSVFMTGILPGDTHADRLALLSDMDRLMAETTERAIDPQERFDAFLLDANRTARSRFGGKITYAAGAWETVDWSGFDLVGIDAYRDATNRPTYVDWLRSFAEHGRPVVVTEFGCATYRGAADRGGMAWSVIDRTEEPNRLVDGIIRDETIQAAEIADQLDAIAAAGVDGAFLYTYFAPSYPASEDPVLDLDAASYALLRSWPGGRAEPKLAYHTVAARYATSKRVATGVAGGRFM